MENQNDNQKTVEVNLDEPTDNLVCAIKAIEEELFRRQCDNLICAFKDVFKALEFIEKTQGKPVGLKTCGSRIQAVRAVRDCFGLGLRMSKEVVDAYYKD